MLNKTFEQLKNKFNVVLKSDILTSLSPLERTQLLHLAHERSFSKDEFIYNEGDPGSGFYIIKSGTVKLFIGEQEKSTTEDDSSDALHPELNQHLESERTLCNPESFGVLSLISDHRRYCNAVATEETQVYGFFRPDLDTLKQRYPAIAITLISNIAGLSHHLLREQTRLLEENVNTPEARSVFVRSTIKEFLNHETQQF